MGRSLELADTQASTMESNSNMNDKGKVHHVKQRYTKTAYKKTTKQCVKCRNCGGEYPHKGDCPAKGKTCNFCNKPNHFKSVCRSFKKQNDKPHLKQKSQKCAKVDTGDSSDDDYCYSVSHTNNKLFIKVEECNEPSCEALIFPYGVVLFNIFSTICI